MGCIGIDTSCYRTSVAYADDSGYAQQRRLLNVPKGQLGLMQSELVFQHVTRLPDLIGELIEPGMRVDCVCATTRPRPNEDSYMPVFRVGSGTARAMASALHVPYIETTHQQCHLRAALHGENMSAEQFLALHLSGGTTELMLADKGLNTELLGGTSDLHAGQFVDRVGVALGCGFPAGPELERLATADAKSLLPVAMDDLSCSFSGAESQVRRMIASGAHAPEQIASEVYSLLARTVARLLDEGAQRTGARAALLFGGVASSGLLRRLLSARLSKRRIKIDIHWADSELSGDNAVGAAYIGLDHIKGVG